MFYRDSKCKPGVLHCYERTLKLLEAAARTVLVYVASITFLDVFSLHNKVFICKWLL